MEPIITNQIMMIRPASFSFNEETAANNAFQTNDRSLTKEEVKKKAVEEFDKMVVLLTENGVNVHTIQDTEIPSKPDAVFPNNWISFHQDGRVVLYPMYAPLRRLERRKEIILELSTKFKVGEIIHLENSEPKNIFLEGTGSMILDRPNKIVYACISQRTDEKYLKKWADIMGYTPVAFTSVDHNDHLVYHTNVMMALGEGFVVICMDSVKDKNEKKNLVEVFKKTNKKIIELSLDQMNEFAGNMLQVKGNGKKHLVMSARAYKSLNENQISEIKKYTNILTPELDVIERYGGGSVRCMMAEIFLPSLK
jgi:hypothetical protein